MVSQSRRRVHGSRRSVRSHKIWGWKQSRAVRASDPAMDRAYRHAPPGPTDTGPRRRAVRMPTRTHPAVWSGQKRHRVGIRRHSSSTSPTKHTAVTHAHPRSIRRASSRPSRGPDPSASYGTSCGTASATVPGGADAGASSGIRCARNSSSSVRSSASARSPKRATSGRHAPRSHLLTALPVTPSLSARSFCVRPFASRSSRRKRPNAVGSMGPPPPPRIPQDGRRCRWTSGRPPCGTAPGQALSRKEVETVTDLC